jgi:hypothetical protein
VDYGLNVCVLTKIHRWLPPKMICTGPSEVLSSWGDESSWTELLPSKKPQRESSTFPPGEIRVRSQPCKKKYTLSRHQICWCLDLDLELHFCPKAKRCPPN